MGIYNRDYMKDSSGTGRGPGWTIVGWLIALNVAVYVIQHLLLDQTSPGGGFSLGDLFNGRFYTLVTSLFVHAGIMHIVFNMAMLFFAGKELLARVGLRHFLWVYFLGGISGTVLEAAVTALQGYNVNQIGASGAIMALICALATLIPWHRFSFLFFFVIPVTLTMRTFVMVLIGLDLVLGLIGVFSASTESLLGGKVAHFAHLGGAFWGLFYGWVILGRLNRGQKRKNAGLKLVPRTEGGTVSGSWPMGRHVAARSGFGQCQEGNREGTPLARDGALHGFCSGCHSGQNVGRRSEKPDG
ncbi:MAG: rhomboid family intramembrane serine protease [Verrucomicrobiales bacterium]